MEDVDATLADLEARLRALQADLAAEDPAPPPPPAGTERRVVRAERTYLDTRPAGGGPVEVGGGDPLDAFGDRLRRATADLVSAYDAVVGEVRGGDAQVFDDEVALDARADLPGLCALSRALAAVPGVHAVELRAYAGGQAALDVTLDRPVALVAELRGRDDLSFGVLVSRPGRLALEVGASEPPQGFSRG